MVLFCNCFTFMHTGVIVGRRCITLSHTQSLGPTNHSFQCYYSSNPTLFVKGTAQHRNHAGEKNSTQQERQAIAKDPDYGQPVHTKRMHDV